MNRVNKVKSFIQLDFLTVKPYFTFKSLSIYAVIALFLTIFSNTASSSIGFGMMAGTLFMSYPFAVGEKSNMDALYTLLSVNRKTVVLSRYLFTLILNILTIIFFYLITVIGIFISRLTGSETEFGGIFMTILLIAPIAAVIEAVQLPVFFKLGYSKAKFFSLVPFALLAVGFLALTAIERAGVVDNGIYTGIDNFLESLNGISLAALVIFIILIVMYGSYRLSLRFYRKREF